MNNVIYYLRKGGYAMITKVCIVCEKKFAVKNYREKTALYCSVKCREKNQKGKPSWCKGKKIPYMPHPAQKGHIPWNKGKKNIYSAETRKKISEKLKQYSGAKSKAWKGGKYKTQGYVFVYSPEHPRVMNTKRKYIFEHILVMEKMIGRYLNSGEVVHHKNGIRNDNRPENLVLMTRRKHLKHHNPLQHRPKTWTLNRKCKYNNCDRKHWAKGFCRKHYKQMKRRIK